MAHQIPGTPIFDGEAAQKGYALNRMCFSFNSRISSTASGPASSTNSDVPAEYRR
jgi:hypothetical protein